MSEEGRYGISVLRRMYGPWLRGEPLQSEAVQQPPADAGLCSECGRALPGEGDGVCDGCEERMG